MAEDKHWKEVMNPNFLGSWFLKEDQEITVTIKDVQEKDVKNETGKTDRRNVLIFQEDVKPWVLNATNAKIIYLVYGVERLNQYVGLKITLQRGLAKDKSTGKMVPCLQIKPKRPDGKELTPDMVQFQKAADRLREGTTTMEIIKKNYTLSTENEKLLIRKSK